VYRLIRNSAGCTIFFVLLAFCLGDSYAKDRGTVLFDEANQLYRDLAADPERSKDKEIWEIIAQAFFSVYESYPESKKAPNSLFLSGKMYEEIGNRFKSDSAYRKSIDVSRQFVETFPLSNLADDAQIRIARIYEKLGDNTRAYVEYNRIIEDLPQGDMINAARKNLKRLARYKPKNPEKYKYSYKTTRDSKPKITKIRHWSTPDSTRVVIHLDKKTSYSSKLLKADPNIDKPPRLFVDINNTAIDKNLHVEPITKGLLGDIKFGRNTRDKSRVVLYINSFDDYKVFALQNPYRIVMDIQGDGTKTAKTSKKKYKSKYKPKSLPSTEQVDSLRQALGLKIRTVVIDPGHGGHDPGAIGPNGVKEKDINLKIAKELKKILDKKGNEIGIDKVYLTRSNDRFIPLEERTAIAQKHNADLFISIHCNASKDRKATGSETYILSFTKNKRSLEVAARENATTTKRVSDLDDILKKYLLSSKIEESEKFAGYVQSSIYNTVAPKYKPFKNKGIKKAPFIVLIGADIPSILVETSFITNPTEEKRLNNSKYRTRIAEGIFKGIKQYSSEIHTASINY
ncbi:MAG: N-acetylmuramoyl-L-alanine amidase, partial [Thermodesulfobacteriota bacterium]